MSVIVCARHSNKVTKQGLVTRSSTIVPKYTGQILYFIVIFWGYYYLKKSVLDLALKLRAIFCANGIKFNIFNIVLFLWGSIYFFSVFKETQYFIILCCFDLCDFLLLFIGIYNHKKWKFSLCWIKIRSIFANSLWKLYCIFE